MKNYILALSPFMTGKEKLSEEVLAYRPTPATLTRILERIAALGLSKSEFMRRCVEFAEERVYLDVREEQRRMQRNLARRSGKTKADKDRR